MITTTLLLINWGNAFIVVGIGFGTVFIILIALVILLNFWNKMSIFATNSQQKKKVKTSTQNRLTGSSQQGSAPEEAIVAIAMALHSCFEEIHDVESNIITINTEEQHASPWNLKNYDTNNITTRR